MKEGIKNLRSTQVDNSKNVIDFGIGQPDPTLLPLDILKQAADHRFENDPTSSLLPYGCEEGCGFFRQELASFLTESYHTPVTPDELFITNGNSQGLDMVCTLFCHEGDTIFVEDPTYNLALKIFADYDLNIIGIPMDDEGIIIEALEEKLSSIQPKFLYTVPTFHNPTGITLSKSRREKLITLSQKHQFLIVADEVYQLLSYNQQPPTPFGSYIKSGTVLSLGTFSKILSPGLRLGWIQTSPELYQKLLQSGLVISGGGLNPFASGMVRSVLELDLLEGYISQLRKIFGQRSKVLCSALKQELPDSVSFKEPDGGYFIWIQFPENIDMESLIFRTRDEEIGFRQGIKFSSNKKFKNYARFCFAYYDEQILEQGVKRLAKLI